MILLWLGVEPRSKADQEKLGLALQRLLADDSSLAIRSRPPDGVVTIGASSEAQLERVVDRLVHEFGVEAAIAGLDIAYKEALTLSAAGEAKYAKRLGGRGQYAHVRIRVRPLEQGSGFVFEDGIVGGAIPAEFAAPIEEGIAEALDRGPLAGYPIDDVHVTLDGGSYREQDSSAVAFKVAAALAFQDAARKAGPILLEPMMNVIVTAAIDDEETVIRSLQARRGVIHSHDTRGNAETIAAMAPLSAMFGFESELRQRTGGRGMVSMEFSHYAPTTLAGDDGDRDTPVREPKHPRMPPHVLRASVPEPPPDFDDFPPFRREAAPRLRSSTRGR
jgi:elongation factor G